MEQTPEQMRARELVANGAGNQLIAICELTAKVEALTTQLAAVTKERDTLKAEKAGVSAS